jgi:hypothetical protein
MKVSGPSGKETKRKRGKRHGPEQIVRMLQDADAMHNAADDSAVVRTSAD